MVVNCLINCAALVVNLVFMCRPATIGAYAVLTPASIAGLLFLFIAIFLKEVVYLFIVMFMAARINDISQALMLALGVPRAGATGRICVESRHS